jgi:hypothetical protein
MFHYCGYYGNISIVITVPVLILWGKAINLDSKPMHVTEESVISYFSVLKEALYVMCHMCRK